MRTDAEVGFAIHDRNAVTAFRRRLWFEHFQVNWDTRDIRSFLTKWKAAAVPAKHRLADCSAADFASGVQVVGRTDVPAGQKYNGPGSWLKNVDDDA